MNKAYVFPGQGSQFVGMGKEYYKNYSAFRNTVDEASEISGRNLYNLFTDSDVNKLMLTTNAQLAIAVYGVAMYRTIKELTHEDIALMAGHSLGEITALCCAGAIRFEDLVHIVIKRGQLMQSVVKDESGSMIAIIGMESNKINIFCKEYSQQRSTVEISNYNSPNQTVISGKRNDLDYIAKLLRKQGIKAIPLKVGAPFHSTYMKNIAVEFEEYLKQYNFETIKTPVVSSVTANLYGENDSIIYMLVKQLYMPVLWNQTVSKFVELNITESVDIGPNTVMKKLIIENSDKIYSRSSDEYEIFSNKAQINNSEKKDQKGNLITRCLAAAVCTENKNFELLTYNDMVVNRYQTIKNIQKELEDSKREPNSNEKKTALDLLIEIMKYKKVSIEEQHERLCYITANESGKEILEYKESIRKNILKNSSICII